jgi:Flp pilus assembly pilin Flp
MSAILERLTLALRHRRRDQGQDILEYALLMALISIAALGAVQNVGTTITTVFWNAIAVATP